MQILQQSPCLGHLQFSTCDIVITQVPQNHQNPNSLCCHHSRNALASKQFKYQWIFILLCHLFKMTWSKELVSVQKVEGFNSFGTNPFHQCFFFFFFLSFFLIDVMNCTQIIDNSQISMLITFPYYLSNLCMVNTVFLQFCNKLKVFWNTLKLFRKFESECVSGLFSRRSMFVCFHAFSFH